MDGGQCVRSVSLDLGRESVTRILYLCKILLPKDHGIPDCAGRAFCLTLKPCSVSFHTSNVRCEERETLTQAYLDAAENSRKVSDSIEDIHSSEWREAIKEAREDCERALAALKLHIREHGCPPQG
jgi:hypothetical protein